MKTQIDRAIETIRRNLDNPFISERARDYLEELLKDILAGQEDYEYRIEELEAKLVRNPDFDGDYVGWLPDDFDDDDDEDENEDENRDR